MPTESAPAGKSPHLIVNKPISFLHRELKADIGGLFKTLGKSVVHLGTGKYLELAADSSEALAALGLQTDPGGLAWHLIQHSLLRAMHALANEAWLRRTTTEPPKLSGELEDHLDREIERATLEVDRDFFRQPGALPFLEPCAGWFRQWLVSVGFDQAKAASISQRLRSYFVYALNQEWRAHADLYARIVTAAETPFTKAGERERAWEQYRAWLDQELDGPMFGEPFSLRQLFIPLRAYYTRQAKGLSDAPATRETAKDAKRVAVDLASNLLAWVNGSAERDDAFRVVSGGPGSGKSSVMRMFTAQVLAETGWRALYVPLHRIKYKGDLVPAIEEYLRGTQVLPGHPQPLSQETGDRQLLVIFDGLDELAMLGKVAEKTAGQFVRAVKDLVRDYNTRELRLKAILTARTVIMGDIEPEFRREGAVLHLCPYFVADNEAEKECYERGWDLLADNDQRQRWWRTYGELDGKPYAGLPPQFDRSDLVEVSSEPLLNYLLALADQTATLDFSKQVTQNEIYASLVHELYDRRWADGNNFAVRGMTEDRFQRVLEEVAVAAWHGDGRKTTVGEIRQHCQDAGITAMLETFQEGAESGVLRLLTAFFFRQAGVRDDENAFEFTHKSFGEYLVARRLVRMVATMERKSEEQRESFEGWNEQTCLEQWARLCGPTALTERQWEFLKNEMSLSSASPAAWQKLMTALIGVMLRQGMPMHRLGLKDFQTMHFQSRNAEEALLLTLNSCALVTLVISEIAWPAVTTAGTWVKKLQQQNSAGVRVLAMSALSWLDLTGAILEKGDFSRADLSFSCLEYCDGQLTCMLLAQLCGAKLGNADFSRANLERANLTEADLAGANVMSANLEKAVLRGANLKATGFTEADLTEADLRRADLTGAFLRRASLLGATLNGANLTRAFLKDADLRFADLRGADFTEAYLARAHFQDAELTGVDTTRAIFNEAIGIKPKA